MHYMHSHRLPPQHWSEKGLLGILRASLAAGSSRAASSASDRPAPAPDDPLPPLSAEELGEIARKWRSRAGEDEDRADTVAQALESLADHRRAAAAPRSAARKVGERISACMRI